MPKQADSRRDRRAKDPLHGARTAECRLRTRSRSERTGLFKIIGEIADESSVDDLIARIEGKDPVARLHIINVLARFNLPKVQQAVQKQLKDNNKLIRSAALSALARWTARSTCR